MPCDRNFGFEKRAFLSCNANSDCCFSEWAAIRRSGGFTAFRMFHVKHPEDPNRRRTGVRFGISAAMTTAISGTGPVLHRGRRDVPSLGPPSSEPPRTSRASRNARFGPTVIRSVGFLAVGSMPERGRSFDSGLRSRRRYGSSDCSNGAFPWSRSEGNLPAWTETSRGQVGCFARSIGSDRFAVKLSSRVDAAFRHPEEGDVSESGVAVRRESRLR